MAFSFEPFLAISAGHFMAVSAGPEHLFLGGVYARFRLLRRSKGENCYSAN